MKIVRKSILDKINDAIDKYEDIVRIELTLGEFDELRKEVKERGGKGVEKIVIRDTCLFDTSSSYMVIRGVYVQTHREYV